MSTLVRFFLLSLLLGSSLAAAPKPWGKLKVGMTSQQAIALLGEPIFRRHGKGFETWTYDQGSEVLVYSNGTVVGWTAPASAGLAVRSRDVWSAQPTDEYYATLYSLLQILGPPAADATAPTPKPAAVKAASGTGYEQFLREKS